jgi:hypothetical protein
MGWDSMTIILSTTLAALLAGGMETPSPSSRGDLPGWAVKRIERLERQRRLVVSGNLEPRHVEADLDGDRAPDLAVLVRGTRSGKTGIAILLRNRDGAVLLGAGSDFGNGGDDFSWMDEWSVYPRSGHGAGRPKLRGDALLVAKREAASALVYWDGKSFRWYQLGD